ncbi:MAG: LEA type 2 family protein [Spirochaetota bacterium]|nr:MAG: LEA type 2 family protein [Spirochaetota bacterium]
MENRKTRILFCIIGLFILIIIISCTGPAELLTERLASPPKVRIASAELTSLSFTDAEILFDLGVDNSNPIGLTMLGFEYDLIIENNSFIKGKQDGEISIEPRSETIIPFPLSFEFEKVFRTFKNLVEKDSVSYTLKLNPAFEVPVLGRMQVPVEHSGVVPIPKLPTITVHALRIKHFDLISADLVLDVTIKNPNIFVIDISRFQYNFSVDQFEWASGETKEISVPEKKTSTVEIPITLDFISIGRSVYLLVSGSDTVSYSFSGGIDFSTSLPLLDPITLPFEHSGEIKLIR